MKTCSVCGEAKELEDFYPHTRCRENREGTCKACKIQAAKQYYFDNLSARKKYFKKYHAANREKIRHWSKNKRLREPQKERAHRAVNNALRDGRLGGMPCEVCGASKAEAHHADYSKPLEVRWLCLSHHRELHARDPKELLR